MYLHPYLHSHGAGLDVGHPVAVVLRLEAAGHEEDDVDQPPHAHATQGQLQFPSDTHLRPLAGSGPL